MQGQTSKRILKAQLQRGLRNAPTDAEYRLWQRLRGRQLDDCKFRRQHPFGNYILDLVCLERRVLVELDGSQHSTSINCDLQRTQAIEHAGFVVFRFWNNQIYENIDGVLEMILLALGAKATPSPPNPPLEGEG